MAVTTGTTNGVTTIMEGEKAPGEGGDVVMATVATVQGTGFREMVVEEAGGTFLIPYRSNARKHSGIHLPLRAEKVTGAAPSIINVFASP